MAIHPRGKQTFKLRNMPNLDSKVTVVVTVTTSGRRLLEVAVFQGILKDKLTQKGWDLHSKVPGL